MLSHSRSRKDDANDDGLDFKKPSPTLSKENYADKHLAEASSMCS